ncbi:MAG: hypothetical protein ACD_76C00006G0003 [uncultured bacterium]|nr:MAG: hypothetical protein ACD_76C00006G0003 [uncultured bacterium]HBD05472.1 hypothetical protein [Candidatus Uhrbacteria bacterium]
MEHIQKQNHAEGRIASNEVKAVALALVVFVPILLGWIFIVSKQIRVSFNQTRETVAQASEQFKVDPAVEQASDQAEKLNSALQAEIAPILQNAIETENQKRQMEQLIIDELKQNLQTNE